MQTPNVRLRPVLVEDAEFICTLVTDPAWLQYIGDRGVNDKHTAQQFIVNSIQPVYAQKGMGLMVVEDAESEQTWGLCGLLQRDFLDAPDLGFALLPVARGKGIALAASELSLRAAEKMGHTHVYAYTSAINDASQGLIKRLDFEFERHISPHGEELYLFKKSFSPLS
ncbi:GNAT family N-acetyltransferase [Alteromonas facilis]|uniref:GNAT family N-acetyltransferase n=1 Tax=Alteromonas facilis TaxID=2048004 RepID=UPI000C282B7C|nr:GNAT family N-acetyltransferase [Alteromonas facilis]